uniref:Uncharacterized protein n=1 Tax=Knipowitschia caucasica TaxID=637954 RepID=A0AAV2IV28_KNICA
MLVCRRRAVFLGLERVQQTAPLTRALDCGLHVEAWVSKWKREDFTDERLESTESLLAVRCAFASCVVGLTGASADLPDLG